MVYSLIEWWVCQMWKWYVLMPLRVLVGFDLAGWWHDHQELTAESRRPFLLEAEFALEDARREGREKVRGAIDAYREAQQAARPRGGSGVKEPKRFLIARNVPEYLPMDGAVVEVSEEIFREWERRDAYLRETGWDDFNALRELDDWLVENGSLTF